MTLPAYRVERATPLLSDQLFPFLKTALSGATRRVSALMFFVDIRLFEDPRRSARTVLEELSYAAWRGVETRLILSPTNAADIELGNGTSAFYAAERGVEVRWFASSAHRSAHSKFVIIDDRISIIGSHNWTDRGLHVGIEAAVAIESPDFASELGSEFARVWDTSQPVEAR